jgi:chromosome segregation ATPase
MDPQETILLEEKIAELEGRMRKIQDEKLKLQSDIDFLTREKEILMRALDDFKQIESTMEEVRIKNIQLESQLASMISSQEHVEKALNKMNPRKSKGFNA